MGFTKQTNIQTGWGRAAPAGNPQLRQVTPPEPRIPALEYTGVFTGAEMKNQGIISQGKKAGQPWTLLRLNFVNGTMGNQRNSHFSAFTPLTVKNGKGLQPNQLEFGKEYKVLYNEKPYTNEYGDQIGKTAFMVLPIDLNKQGSPKNTQMPNQAITQPQQQYAVKTPVNAFNTQNSTPMQVAHSFNAPICNILPEEQDLWDNTPTPFSNETEWMQIAEASNLFDSEERAKTVWNILSKQ